MLFGLAKRRIPGVIGVRNHITYELRMYCVEDGEEVRPVRVAIFWVLVLQVLHHLTITMELGEDVLDSEFIILRHSDKLAFGYR